MQDQFSARTGGGGGRAVVFRLPLTLRALANTMHGFKRALRVSFIGLIICDIVLGDHFTDLWAVHIEGGEEVARNVAAKHGFAYRGQVRKLSSALSFLSGVYISL